MPNPNLNIVGACERMIAEAQNLVGQNYAYNLQRKTGALDAITSPENGSVDTQMITYDSGRKITTLRVYYDQRTKPCQISTDCDTNVCDAGTTPVRKAFNFDIENCLSTPVRSYSNDDMVVLCKDPEAFMRDRSMNDLRAGRERLDELILAEMLSARGINYGFDGTNTAAGANRPAQLLFDSNGQPTPQPGNFAEMMEDYMNNQLTGTPLLIGQGNIALFWRLHGMSCCNTATPYGESNIEGEARFYMDQAANSILDDNNIIMLAPGAMHLFTFNENRNIAATGVNSPDAFHTVVPDPIYPFDWNFDFYFDHCDKVWKSQYSLMWGVTNIFRDDSFAASGEDTSPDISPDCNDELDGMLGVFGYNISKG